MNKVFKISFIIPLLALIIWSSSCDKIENVYKPDFGGIDTSLYPGPGIYEIPEFGEYPSEAQNILLEDFTGHTCVNCPVAGDIAHELKEENSGRVIVASIHASPDSTFQDFTIPSDPTYPMYSHNFNTEAGTEYTIDIPGFIGNPTGLINRTTDDAGQIWKFHPSWGAQVHEILDNNLPLLMNVQVNTNYYTETRGLFVHVQSETFRELAGRYNLVIYLIDDEYIDWQKDKDADPEDVEFYHHHDVLLHNINGTWGSQLFDGSSAVGETFVNHYTYQLPEDIELDGSDPNSDTGLSLIVYLMNRDTYEIIQVIEQGLLVTY